MYLNEEQTICTLDQAKKLKALGVPQFASLSFYEYPEGAHIPTMEAGFPGRVRIKRIGNYPNHPQGGRDDYSAYNGAELGELLPLRSFSWKAMGLKGPMAWEATYIINSGRGQTEVEARADLLIQLLESGQILVGELPNTPYFAAEDSDYHPDAQVQAARKKYKAIIETLTFDEKSYLRGLNGGPEGIQVLSVYEINMMQALVRKEAVEIGSTDGSDKRDQITYTPNARIKHYLDPEAR